MEARIARIESDVAHLQTNVAHLRTDLADFKVDVRMRFDKVDARIDRLDAKLDAFKDDTHANFAALKDRIAAAEVRTLLLHFTLTAGLLGVLARGFGWI
jgi:uncharacterized coiled-coil protein SlyX